MFAAFIKTILLAVILASSALLTFAQTDASSRVPGSRDDQPDEPKSFSDMMAKRRIEQAKKDHENMLERADKTLRLTEELGYAYEKTGALSKQDLQKLNEVEKLVTRIRSDLGGSGDEENTGTDASQPSNIADALKYLQKTAAGLAEELKKSTRFTISAVAIQSSNNILKVLRFLRVRK